MIKFKKFVRATAFSALTAVTVLSSGTLAGCSKSDANQANTDGNKNASPTISGKKEEPKPKESEKNEEETLSDTIRWFNASYAILTELNGWDYNIFAGLKPSFTVAAGNQQMLEDSWGVTDRQTAEETLEWILSEGHRYDFVDDATYLEECGLGEIDKEDRVDALLYSFEISEEDAEFYAKSYDMYEQFGAGAIDAWDYCRALNLMGFFYLAGYYNETEALDASLEIAKTLQAKFDSWDALVDSYLRGYEYWAEESSDARRKIYEDLKKRDDNPYSVDYNTELVKTW